LQIGAHVGSPNFGSKVVKNPKKNPVRESRVHNQAIVDKYGPEEQTMGWYYYLDSNIRFPVQAYCMVSRVESSLRKGETVEVRSMAPEEACSRDMLVLIRWQGRNLAVPSSQLTPIGVDATTAEAFSDWNYWITQGCLR
jgi:hypothetical protein